MSRLSKVLRPLRAIVVGLAVLAVCVAVTRLGSDALASLLGLSELLASTLRRLGVVAALVLGYWLFVRFEERRAPSELAVRPVLCVGAALLGAAMISLSIGALYAGDYYAVVATRGLGGVPFVALGLLAAAALEEFVFRGVLFRALERSTGTLTALAVVSVAFGALHLFNDGTGAMTFLSVSLLGALWTGIFALTRNLWACTFHHAAWNLAIFATGLPLSGLEDLREQAPLESSARGPTLLTGGAFGPEDSIVNVAVLCVAVAVVLRLARERGMLAPRGRDRPLPAAI